MQDRAGNDEELAGSEHHHFSCPPLTFSKCSFIDVRFDFSGRLSADGWFLAKTSASDLHSNLITRISSEQRTLEANSAF